jgi:hypothetical protein
MKRHASSSFEAGTTPITADCFGTTTAKFYKKSAPIGVSSTTPNAKGSIYRYTAYIGANGNRCSFIDMLVITVSTSSPSSINVKAESGGSLDLVYPGYDASSKSCAPGAVCTLASVAGYDAYCNGYAVSGVLKRQVLLEF